MAARRGNPARAESGATRMPARPAARGKPAPAPSATANNAQAGTARPAPGGPRPQGDGVAAYARGRYTALPAERQALADLAPKLRPGRR